MNARAVSPGNNSATGRWCLLTVITEGVDIVLIIDCKGSRGYKPMYVMYKLQR